MKILVLGTSNSILKSGWVAGLRSALPEAEIVNKSIGGSPGAQFVTAVSEPFEDYDFVFFDSVPNDERYYGFTGSDQHTNSLLFEIFTTIAARTRLIILGFCEHRHFKRASATYRTRVRLAEAVGAQFVGIRDLVAKYGRQLGDIEKPLFETDAHPQQVISRIAYSAEAGH